MGELVRRASQGPLSVPVLIMNFQNVKLESLEHGP